MSTSSVIEDREQGDYQRYRSLCLAAVLSLVFGFMSIPALFLSGLLFMPVLGVTSAFLAFRRIRSAPDELTGRGLAWAGLLLSLTVFLAGTAIATTVYMTELPEGCRRLTFAELQPSDDASATQVPDRIVPLDGQRVFVKGYVLADDRSADLRKFVLVPDMKTCCFGGNPKLSDMIEVTLREPLTVKFSFMRRKLAGTFRVDTSPKRENGADGPHYRLDADYVR